MYSVHYNLKTNFMNIALYLNQNTRSYSWKPAIKKHLLQFHCTNPEQCHILAKREQEKFVKNRSNLSVFHIGLGLVNNKKFQLFSRFRVILNTRSFVDYVCRSKDGIHFIIYFWQSKTTLQKQTILIAGKFLTVLQHDQNLILFLFTSYYYVIINEVGRFPVVPTRMM